MPPRYLANLSPDCRAVLGIPPPGDAFWTPHSVEAARSLAEKARLSRLGRARKRAGLFGAYLRFFRFPTAFAVRRALAKFGLGAPGSGLDPEAVAVALAVGLPGTEPAAALRVARCGL